MPAAYLKGPEQERTKSRLACLKKQGYPTERRAREAASWRLAKPNCQESALWVYLCQECGDRHMTKQANRATKPVQREVRQ